MTSYYARLYLDRQRRGVCVRCKAPRDGTSVAVCSACRARLRGHERKYAATHVRMPRKESA